MKNLTMKSGLDGFISEFYQSYKERIEKPETMLQFIL